MGNPENLIKAYCTTREAADLLGVSLRTVQLWSEAGLLECWKTSGGHRRIARTSVEKLFLARPAVTDEVQADDRGASLRILVVEDEPALLRLYERYLPLWPMKPQVVTANNGFDALVRIGLTKPDLVVTDLRMPEMDGFQMLRRLKAMPELADVGIVVVTGLDPQDIESRGGIPPGIPILPKPIPFERLRDIATIVADRKARSQRTTRVPFASAMHESNR